MRFIAFLIVLLFPSLVITAEVPYFQYFQHQSTIAYHASTIATALLHNALCETSMPSRSQHYEQQGNYYSDVEWHEVVPYPAFSSPSIDYVDQQETLISSSMPARISRSYQPLYENGFPTEAFFEALVDENSELQQYSRTMLEMAAVQQRMLR